MIDRLTDHMGELQRLDLPMGNHESDLLVRDTPEAREIVVRHGYTFTTFINLRPPHVGEVWLDVPFAFLPWWEARARRHPTV